MVLALGMGEDAEVHGGTGGQVQVDLGEIMKALCVFRLEQRARGEGLGCPGGGDAHNKHCSPSAERLQST